MSDYQVTTFGGVKVGLKTQDRNTLTAIRGILGYTMQSKKSIKNMDVVSLLDPEFCFVGGRKNSKDIHRLLSTTGKARLKVLLEEALEELENQKEG